MAPDNAGERRVFELIYSGYWLFAKELIHRDARNLRLYNFPNLWDWIVGLDITNQVMRVTE